MFYGDKNMVKQKGVFLGIRITEPLNKLIERYINLEVHINKSDFVRDAIREKIRDDAPHLYQSVFRTPGDNTK